MIYLESPVQVGSIVSRYAIRNTAHKPRKWPLSWTFFGADDGIRTRDPHLGKVRQFVRAVSASPPTSTRFDHLSGKYQEIRLLESRDTKFLPGLARAARQPPAIRLKSSVRASSAGGVRHNTNRAAAMIPGETIDLDEPRLAMGD